MSHFTVMIIGDHPNLQLSPFDENTEVPKYSRGIVSDEDKERFVNFYTVPKENSSRPREVVMIKNRKLSFDELYEENGQDWNSKSWVKNSKGELHEYSTYNPKSKWDWYQLGGRWSGMLKLKEGTTGRNGEKSWANAEQKDVKGHTDQTALKNIDIDGMIADARKTAGEHYDKVLKACGGEIPELKITWDDMLADESIPDMAVKREKFLGQKEVVFFKEKAGELIGWSGGLDDYQLSRDEYVKAHGSQALSTFAVLRDGEWYEKGEMGWWGMASNEKDQADWDNEIVKLLKETDPETLISIYDLHI